MMERSINAFTIVEMLVVMVLSAIVSMLLYQAVLSISTLYHRFQNHQEQLQQITTYYKLIQKDFFEAEALGLEHETLFIMVAGAPITYAAYENKLIRTSSTTSDSLVLANISLVRIASDTAANSFCAVLTFDYEKEVVQWQFNKRYPTAQLFKNLARP